MDANTNENKVKRTEEKDCINLCIVDQNKLTRTVFEYSLNEHKTISVKGVFENIYDCIEFIDSKEYKIDIAIIELRYKRAQSFKLINSIKEKCPGIKIIITTSFTDEDVILKALSCEISAYVLKDIDFEELYNVVCCVRKGSMWLDNKISKLVIEILKQRLEQKADSELINKLTGREKQVLKFLSEGLSNTEISKQLLISSHTVKAHVSSIISKLAVTDRVQAAVKAYRCRLF